jgi:N-acetylmuramoyl-L-alanine amidase
MRTITHHSVHCSASDHAHHDNVETIRKWHVEEKNPPWKDIGYHFIITKNGDIHECRPIDQTPAAVLNHNKDMVATCLTGNKIFSDAQFRSLRRLDKRLKKEYNFTVTKGHNEYSGHESRKCPNFDIHTVLAQSEGVHQLF